MKEEIEIDNHKLQNLLNQFLLRDKEKNKKIEEIRAIMEANRRKRIRRRILFLGTPISAAAILILWFSIFKRSETFSADEFYQQHFNKEINDINYRGEQNINNDSTFKLEEVADQISIGKEAMANENWQEAETIFRQLQSLGGSVRIECLWHLSLISLKTDNLPQCKTYLKELIHTKDPTYLLPARKLLKAID